VVTGVGGGGGRVSLGGAREWGSWGSGGVPVSGVGLGGVIFGGGGGGVGGGVGGR